MEILVSLAILAAVTGIAATAVRGPSPALRLDAAANALIRDAAQARHRAVTEARMVEFALPHCGGGTTVVLFNPDGTATASEEACLDIADLSRRLRVSPLSGRLVRLDAE